MIDPPPNDWSRVGLSSQTARLALCTASGLSTALRPPIGQDPVGGALASNCGAPPGPKMPTTYTARPTSGRDRAASALEVAPTSPRSSISARMTYTTAPNRGECTVHPLRFPGASQCRTRLFGTASKLRVVAAPQRGHVRASLHAVPPPATLSAPWVIERCGSARHCAEWPRTWWRRDASWRIWNAKTGN